MDFEALKWPKVSSRKLKGSSRKLTLAASRKTTGELLRAIWHFFCSLLRVWFRHHWVSIIWWKADYFVQKFPESFSGPTLKSRRAHYTLAILDYRLTGANQELSPPTHVTKDFAIMKFRSSSDPNTVKVQSKCSPTNYCVTEFLTESWYEGETKLQLRINNTIHQWVSQRLIDYSMSSVFTSTTEVNLVARVTAWLSAITDGVFSSTISWAR